MAGVIASSAALPLSAEVLWQDFSVTYLKGHHYRVGTPTQQVYTIEHAAATSWGDSFFFLDHARETDGSRSNYAEWAPRLSASKLTGKSYSYGFVDDLLLSTTVEMSELQTNFLYGVGADFSVPGFQFAQLNAYRRVNDHQTNNWQLTGVWAVPFALGQQSFLFDGFFDWTNTTADQRSSFNTNIQLKWGLHPLLGLSQPLYMGLEYVYWRNKYGIADNPFFRTNESNMNLLVKVHF
ncbi:nucleoside-binding protein [Aliidiomarina taiwanensis]|uniref:Nucleoside-binding protein n=2 Tax=Aliidiomarina taiwanensis TaxID=946228 RepID=A0A432X240_9GAMM|nr:nucleoside-binding protein [Aliidiomarina taiwanensis]